MEIEIVSETEIKPSSPTPPHLKFYNLSLLDQFAPGNHIPMIFFYSSPSELKISETSLLLKQSLSESLTHYYPLAGRIKDAFSIHCNDRGAYYAEAKASISLTDYLIQPDLFCLNKLLPALSNWREMDSPSSYLVSVQQTVFSCGGISIGILVSHKIMDGTAVASFLKVWAEAAAATARKGTSPFLDGSAVCPSFSGFSKDANMVALNAPFVKVGKFSVRRFVFDASAVSSLKARATTSEVPNPTRVEALSAFLLGCIDSIFNQTSPNKPSAVMMAVNLRRRASPPVSEALMGNFFWLAHEIWSPEEAGLSSMVLKLRGAIRKIDGELVKELRDGGFDKLYKSTKEMLSGLKSSSTSTGSTGANFILMSSWCNFGLYEVDFGWGKPKWVTCATSSAAESESAMLNLVILMDSGERDKGVEAWVYMDEDELVLLEQHHTLLQYASLNPSPLK